MPESQSHPAFPQPESSTVLLWRYLDFWKFEWFVTYGRLYMPSASYLGDPLEGTRPAGDLAWWKCKIDNAESQEQRLVLEHNLKVMTHFADRFRPHYYVSCWHMNEMENKQMWGCYTGGPRAVAVKAKYSTLRNLIPTYVEMGLVRYIDYGTNRLPSINLMECITHKHTRYAFESEVRAAVLHPPPNVVGGKHFQENHFESETEKGRLVFAPPINVTELIECVVLHPQATQDFETEVALLCEEDGLPQPVRSAF